jgi:hypothetical protein
MFGCVNISGNNSPGEPRKVLPWKENVNLRQKRSVKHENGRNVRHPAPSMAGRYLRGGVYGSVWPSVVRNAKHREERRTRAPSHYLSK